MLLSDQRIQAFSSLGIFINDYLNAVRIKGFEGLDTRFDYFDSAVQKARSTNLWFTDESIQLALAAIASMLDEKQLKDWTNLYSLNENSEPKIIGVILAGNIPVVGFHDFLCVIMSGNLFLGKLSSDDAYLLPALADELILIEPKFKQSIRFTDGLMKKFHAIIATGSDNSSRYFEYYFGRYPNIIRKNRNSIAILNGSENEEDILLLAQDIFTYFGLGCRNVSQLFLPMGFELPFLMKSFDGWSGYMHHHKYFNNYEYNKAVFLVNRIPHFDNGFAILKEDIGFSSPISVVHYHFYEEYESLSNLIIINKEKIQAVVSKDAWWPESIAFGKTQHPNVNDYADGIDTMAFLTSL